MSRTIYLELTLLTYSETHDIDSDSICSDHELEIIKGKYRVKHICEFKYPEDYELSNILINIGFPTCIVSIIEEYSFDRYSISIKHRRICEDEVCDLDTSHSTITNIRIIDYKIAKHLIKNCTLELEEVLLIEKSESSNFYPISCKKLSSHCSRKLNMNLLRDC